MSERAVVADGLAPGTRVGSYEIVRLLAEGGMGAVYEAVHRVTKQRRALKVVRPELAAKSDFRIRFVREVTIASAVKHPNLVDTQDPIEDGDSLALPMELLEGETLSARLRRGKLTVSETLSIVVPCARAVHAVNERSVIHRDLKPLNVFLARQGDRTVPKVLDFGAAREMDDDEHTRTGLVIGSPFYMAPEQAEGRKDLDARVDVYALGVIAYFCLTGRRLYETDSAQSAIAKLLRAEKYPRPTQLDPTIPAAIEAAVLRAIAYDREDRWATLAAFADALEKSASANAALVDPEATVLRDATEDAAPASVEPPSGVRAAAAAFAAPPPVVPRPAAPVASAGPPRAAIAVATLVIAGAIGLGWWITHPASPPPTTVVAAREEEVPSTVVVPVTDVPPTSVAVVVDAPPPSVTIAAEPPPSVTEPSTRVAPPPTTTTSATHTGAVHHHGTGGPAATTVQTETQCGPEFGIPCVED